MFQVITSTDEVRKLAAAGLLWWDKCALAEVAWATHDEELLWWHVDAERFSILLEE